MGRDPGVRRRAIDRAVAQVPCLVEIAEHESSTTKLIVGPTDDAKVSPRHMSLDDLLTFAEPGQRLGRLADSSERPGGCGKGVGEIENAVGHPDNGDPALGA